MADCNIMLTVKSGKEVPVLKLAALMGAYTCTCGVLCKGGEGRGELVHMNQLEAIASLFSRWCCAK